ncbi:MAG: FAD-binding protein [Gaiellaceae bacterium]
MTIAGPELTVAGAGMAGLVAAARARQLGARPTVLEKGDRAGGSMLLSSCVIWRYRTLADFRRECPAGEEDLQRLLVERLDDGLEWLESLGAPVVTRETGNPLTLGVRFEPRGLTETLARAAGEIRLCTDFRDLVAVPGTALVLATGGFGGDPELVARHITLEPLALRANPWSAGDGLRFALDRGAATSTGLDQFHGRNMPDADFGEHDFVRLAQLYARHALVVDEQGEPFLGEPPSWSETDVVQASARQPGARAWYVLAAAALQHRVRKRTVGEMVEAARGAGAPVLDASELPFPVPASAKVAVRVRAAITHTIGGLRVDESARVLRDDGTRVEGLYAAGVDAGGFAAGGYASGLAQALVLGLAAAEDLAR